MSHSRLGATAAVVAAVSLGLLGCSATDADTSASTDDAAVSSASPSDDAATDESSEPADSADSADSADDAAAADDEADAATSAGAYIEYSEGIIESTAGPKALFFHASWCPNCRNLDSELNAQGAPDGLTVIKADFDSETGLRQEYGVTQQTTIVFLDDDGNQIENVVLYDDPSRDGLIAAMP